MLHQYGSLNRFDPPCATLRRGFIFFHRLFSDKQILDLLVSGRQQLLHWKGKAAKIQHLPISQRLCCFDRSNIFRRRGNELYSKAGVLATCKRYHGPDVAPFRGSRLG